MWDPLDDLSPAARATLDAYYAELVRLNRRVNLVSPRSLEDGVATHLRHSLALARRPFPPGATVVDWGSGGGLPAVPLAIRFPETEFVAVDAVGKKMEAVRTVARRLGLANLRVWNGRAEAFPEPVHLAVSRATAPLADLWAWTERVLTPWDGPWPDEAWAPGLLTLKGGDLADEIRALPDGLAVHTHDLTDWMGDDWATKKLVTVLRDS